MRDDWSVLTWLAHILAHAVCCTSVASSGWSLHLIISQLRMKYSSSNCLNHVRRTDSSVKQWITVCWTVWGMFSEQTVCPIKNGLYKCQLLSKYYLLSTESKTVQTCWRHNYYHKQCLKLILNWANVCSPEHTSDTSTNYDSFLNWTFSSPNMVRTVQTLLHSQLACNEMQASAWTCSRCAADSMIENVG